MSERILKYFLPAITIIVFAHCVKPYNPPALQARNNYLVVDGFINTGANQVTVINLTRTRSLSDSTTATDPELHASSVIASDDGSMYPLTETGNGAYQSAALNLNNSKTYQLKITTSNGNTYSSELVASRQTPPIDSLTWQQQHDVNIYLYTHDPANNTHYYKWDYTETWQYNSILQGSYVVIDNYIYVADKNTQIDSCWQTDSSATILTGTSISLSDDVINHAKIATILQNDDKIFVRYSMQVKQRAITQEAYKYWQIVQKNSQDRGGLFDLQPGQLVGNIHCETDPTEPVIGFINASSQTTSRLFINHNQLTDWERGPTKCDTKTTPQNPVDFRIYSYPDPNYTAFFFSGSDVVIAQKLCVDCRTHGGTNQRPSYW
jgi:hypothetical protein